MSYRIREAIQVRSLVFLSTWTRQSVVSHVLKQTKRSVGSMVLNLSLEEISNPRAGRPFTFRARLKQRQSSFARFWVCNQICIYVAVCVWFDQDREARHREVPELSGADLVNLTHRKDLSASGDRKRDSKHSKTIAQVSQEAGFSAEVGKGQYFATRPSINNDGRWTLVCRGHSLLLSNPNAKLVCALTENVRIGSFLVYKDIKFGRTTFS